MKRTFEERSNLADDIVLELVAQMAQAGDLDVIAEALALKAALSRKTKLDDSGQVMSLAPCPVRGRWGRLVDAVERMEAFDRGEDPDEPSEAEIAEARREDQRAEAYYRRAVGL